MNEVHTDRVQIRRLLAVASLGVAGVLLATPALGALGLGPPRKVAHYALIFTTLIALPLTGSRRRADLARESGLGGDPRPAATWWRGFALGVVPLLAYGALLVSLGELEYEGVRRPARLLTALLKYLPLAFLIGILEDVMFFGFFHALFGRRAWPAVLLYGVTHFLHISKRADFSQETWRHGAEALGFMGASLAEVGERWVELVGLLVVGWVLARTRELSGAVWLSMGIHGGWYYVRSVGTKVVDDVDAGHETWFGTDRFYDGVVGWLVLAATGLAVTRWLRRSAQRQREHGRDDDGGDRDPRPGA